MPSWLPNVADLPMGLGDHLHELRRRLVWPLITIGVVFIGAFAFQDRLKLAVLWPLGRALRLAGEKDAIKVGLAHSHEDFLAMCHQPAHCLVVQSLAESTTTAIKISTVAGIALALPVLLWHLWQFVAVGLTSRERRLAFFFLPLGIVLFYIGMIAGYFTGLPYFYAWLIQFTAQDSSASYLLRQSEYIDDFINATLSFGLVMDIPWLVMVLVRTGVIARATIAKSRRYVIAINAVLTCCVCPATDPGSLFLTFLPIQLLFEAGLFCSRFFEPKRAPLIGEP